MFLTVLFENPSFLLFFFAFQIWLIYVYRLPRGHGEYNPKLQRAKRANLFENPSFLGFSYCFVHVKHNILRLMMTSRISRPACKQRTADPWKSITNHWQKINSLWNTIAFLKKHIKKSVTLWCCCNVVTLVLRCDLTLVSTYRGM